MRLRDRLKRLEELISAGGGSDSSDELIDETASLTVAAGQSARAGVGLPIEAGHLYIVTWEIGVMPMMPSGNFIAGGWCPNTGPRLLMRSTTYGSNLSNWSQNGYFASRSDSEYVPSRSGTFVIACEEDDILQTNYANGAAVARTVEDITVKLKPVVV